MKSEVKKLDSTQREINVEISGEMVKNKFDDVFKRIAKEAKVPGFRPGNAPRDILEKHYSAYAQEQVLKELIPDIYEQAIEKEGLAVLELPNITDVKLDRNTLSFKAQVEVRPEIGVKNYKGIKINYQRVSVSADEIKRNLDTLKESRKLDVLPNVVTQADSHRHPEETPQKDTTFGIDDSFARGLGYPDLSELEKAVEKQLFIQKENQARFRIENEIIQGIIKDLDFKLPESLVKRQLEDLVRQAKLDLALKGIEREKIEEQEKTLSAELEPEAKRQVKVYLVLSEIAKKENIPLDEQTSRRVMEFLLKEADWNISEGGAG